MWVRWWWWWVAHTPFSLQTIILWLYSFNYSLYIVCRFIYKYIYVWCANARKRRAIGMFIYPPQIKFHILFVFFIFVITPFIQLWIVVFSRCCARVSPWISKKNRYFIDFLMFDLLLNFNKYLNLFVKEKGKCIDVVYEFP